MDPPPSPQGHLKIDRREQLGVLGGTTPHGCFLLRLEEKKGQAIGITQQLSTEQKHVPSYMTVIHGARVVVKRSCMRKHANKKTRITTEHQNPLPNRYPVHEHVYHASGPKIFGRNL